MSQGAGKSPEVRRVLCLANRSSATCAAACDALLKQLRRAGLEVAEGVEFLEQCRPDLLVVLGGDGFLMESLRLLGYPETPVFGANFGSVGFLMNTKDYLPNLVDMIQRWDFVREEHAVLEARIRLEDGSTTSKLAFNDIVVERMTRQSLRLLLYLDGVPFNHYAGDGFVLSTTAGSTAYNLAAGGPVVHPCLQVVLVTPLYPHRASPFHSMQFSLIVPLGCVVRIDVSDLPKRGMRVVSDGEAIDRAESIEVRDSGRKVSLVRPLSHLFVKTLARKFIGE